MKTTAYRLENHSSEEYRQILSKGNPTVSIAYGEAGERETIYGHLLPAMLLLDFTPIGVLVSYE